MELIDLELVVENHNFPPIPPFGFALLLIYYVPFLFDDQFFLGFYSCLCFFLMSMVRVEDLKSVWPVFIIFCYKEPSCLDFSEDFSSLKLIYFVILIIFDIYFHLTCQITQQLKLNAPIYNYPWFCLT